MSCIFAILEINELREHEEVIEDILKVLAEEIKKDGILKKPILVDKKSMVILDGHHRVHALKRLNYKKVSVFLLDYKNTLEIGKWYRVIYGNPPPDITKKIERKGIKVEKIEGEARIGETYEEYEELLRGYDRLIEEKNALGILIHIKGRTSYLLYPLKEIGNIKQKYAEIAMIEEVFRNEGYPVDYNHLEDTVKKMMAREFNWVLLGPKVGKEDVIDMGLSDGVFAPKTTRHIVKVPIENREVKLEKLL